MQRPPVRTTDSIFAGGLIRHITWVGALTGVIALAVGVFLLEQRQPALADDDLHDAVFLASGASVGDALEPRVTVQDWADQQSFAVGHGGGGVGHAQLGAIYLPFMHGFMYTTPLPIVDLIIAIAASSVVFWAIEIQKWARRRRSAN